VKGVVLWALGTSVAFLATAGAFLLLANLSGGSATSDAIPRAERSAAQESGPALILELSEDQLERLERKPGQRLGLDVKNGGDEEFPSVDLTLDILYENTTQPPTRSYEETVERLAPGEAASVEFDIDLSSPIEGKKRQARPGVDLPGRDILEIRANTPDGVSAVKTAVLAP
jgi:hypothetical protein